MFYPLEKNLLCLGDKSRFIFVKNFASMPGIKFSLPEDESWRDALEKYSRVVVFEEFPFQKDSTQQLIDDWQNINQPRPPLTLVIMDLPHRQGSTDLDNLADALTDAKKNYVAQKIDVVVIRNSSDGFEILHRRESLIDRHKKILSGEVAKIYERLEELEFLHEDFVTDCDAPDGCLSVFAVNEICSFETIKRGGKNSLWAAYNDAAIKKLFNVEARQGNLNELAEIYSYILAGDSADENLLTNGQNLVRLKRQFLAKLKEIFQQYMFAGKFSGTVTPQEIRDALAYKKLTGDKSGRFYGINAAYGRKLKTFVREQTKNFVQVAAESYVNFFERVLR